MRAKSRPNQKSMGQPISDIIEQRQFKTYLDTLGITLPEFRKQNYKARRVLIEVFKGAAKDGKIPLD